MSVLVFLEFIGVMWAGQLELPLHTSENLPVFYLLPACYVKKNRFFKIPTLCFPMCKPVSFGL